jgi:hypothetical protein
VCLCVCVEGWGGDCGRGDRAVNRVRVRCRWTAHDLLGEHQMTNVHTASAPTCLNPLLSIVSHARSLWRLSVARGSAWCPPGTGTAGASAFCRVQSLRLMAALATCCLPRTSDAWRRSSCRCVASWRREITRAGTLSSGPTRPTPLSRIATSVSSRPIRDLIRSILPPWIASGSSNHLRPGPHIHTLYRLLDPRGVRVALLLQCAFDS